MAGNYPDGSTGNLSFIPSAHKNRTFVARTGLFYTVGIAIARRIFTILTGIFVSIRVVFPLDRLNFALKSIFHCFSRKNACFLAFVA